MHLANPSAIRRYEGIKHTDDQWGAFWLAQLLLLGTLTEGCIYPRTERSARDWLRGRLLFVRQRTAHISSLQSMRYRCSGQRISANQIKQLTPADTAPLCFDSRCGHGNRFCHKKRFRWPVRLGKGPGLQERPMCHLPYLRRE